MPEDSNQAEVVVVSKTIEKVFTNETSAQPQDFKSIAEKIKKALSRKGYWWPNITLKQINPYDKPQIIINPESKIIVTDVIVVSEQYPELIKNIFNSKGLNKLSDLGLISSCKSEVIEFLKKNGFRSIKCNITSHEKNSLKNSKRIILKVRVKASRQVKIGEIKIEGNVDQTDLDLPRIIGLKKDQCWDGRKIKNARKKLIKLGAFESVALRCGKPVLLEENNDDPSSLSSLSSQDRSIVIPINILLTKDLKNEFRFSFGIASKSFFYSPSKGAPNNSITCCSGARYQKWSTLRPYDKIELCTELDPFHKNICAEYSYGQLGQWPLEFTSSIFLERFDIETTIENPSYKMISSNLSFSIPSDNFNSGNMFGYQSVKFECPGKNILCKSIFSEPFVSYENIDGDWVSRAGILAKSSMKFSLKVPDLEAFLFSFKSNASMFFPLTYESCVVLKVAASGKKNIVGDVLNPNYQFGKTLISPQNSYEEVTSVFSQESHSPKLNHQLDVTYNFFKPSALDIHLGCEYRRKIYNSVGLAGFCFWKVSKKFKHDFITGLGFRISTPITSLFFDFGWDWSVKKPFWRFSIGDLA